MSQAGIGAQRLQIVPDADWATVVAAAFVDRLVASPALRLCLPTGTTPRPLYAALVAAVAEERVSFRDAEVSLLDEFLGLPPGHRARCESMLRSDLVDHVDLPPEHVHAIDVDTRAPDDSAAAFGRRIARAGGFDLALLGLGANGHVGMNEPGSRPTDGTRVVQLAATTREGSRRYGAEEPPERGITVGLAELLAAREVWLLVRSRHKAAILARTLDGPVTDDLPASHLRAHPNLIIYADEAAAGR